MSRLPRSRGYSISYYDCSTPKEVKTYAIQEACTNHPANNTPSRTYTLLQNRRLETVTGFTCQVTRSTLTEYCGSFSHMKLAKPPEIELHHSLDVEQCMHLVNTERFLGEKIQIGAETTLYTEDSGVIQITDNAVSCRGQSMKINHNVVNDILQVSQYKVVVTKETFNVNVQKGQVEVAATHEMLPPECDLDAGGCRISDRTFVWTRPADRCTLERIRTVTMEEVDGYLIDRTHKILLKKLDQVPASGSCPTMTLYHTEYPQLYLSDTAEWTGAEMGNDLEIEIYIKGRDDYITFELEQKINTGNRRFKQQGCEDDITHKLDHEELLPVGGGTFMKRNGDTIEKFKCESKVAAIEEHEECYNTIPVAAGFVKPYSRVLTQYAARTPCNNFFGLKIHTLDGTWVSIHGRDIVVIPTPGEIPLLEHEFEHEDLSSGGIYTEGELSAWNQHLELGDYHDAISKSLSFKTYGPDRGSAGTFFQSTTTWNQDFMLNPWERFQVFLNSWSTYICALALAIEAGRIAVMACAFAMTLFYDGVDGLKALTYMTCCRSFRRSQKISQRNLRLKKEESIVLEGLREIGDPSLGKAV